MTMTSVQKIVMSFVNFSIYDQFRSFRKPDSRRMVCITYIFINSNFLSYKKYSSHTIALIKGTILLFLKQDKAVYLLIKFQVSSITLTSFRQGGGVILSLPLSLQNETLKRPPRLGLKYILFNCC